MAIVMPRSFSSGALSIWSNAVYLASFAVASTLVMAAVSVVLPWSMWPIVPTFTCGLLRTNFCFAMRFGAPPQSPGAVLCSRRRPLSLLRSAAPAPGGPLPHEHGRAEHATHETSHYALASRWGRIERQRDRRSPRRELNP